MNQWVAFSLFTMILPFLLCFIGLSSAVPIPHLNSQPIIFLEDFAQFSSIPMAEGVQRGEGFRKTMEALFRDSFRESNYAHGHGIKAPIAVKWLDARKDQSENMQRVYGLWDPIDAMIDKKTEHLEDDPLFCARFNPNYQNWYLLGICNEIGHLNVYNTKRAEVNAIKLSTSICFHKNAIFDFAWCPDTDLKVLIASADESISYSDVETGKTLSTFLGHRGSVRAISWCKENPSLFSSVGRDGYLLVWDLRRNERTAAIIVQNAHLDLKKKNVLTQPICAVFHRCQRYVLSAGYAESGIRVWDLRKIRLVSRFHCRPSAVWPYSPSQRDGRKRRYGFTSISSDSMNNFIFVPCTDGTIYQYSALRLDPKPINRFVGAAIRTYYVYPTVCPFAPFLACGSENGQTLIWNYDKWNSPMYAMEGHRVDVCSVSWNIYGQLVTCSDDPSWRIWAPCWDDKLAEKSADYCSVHQLKFDGDSVDKDRMEMYRFRFSDQTTRTTVPEEHRGRVASKNIKPSTVSMIARRALTLDKSFENTPNSSNALQVSNINLPDSSESVLLSSMEECPGSSQSTDSRLSAVRRRRTSILDYFTRP